MRDQWREVADDRICPSDADKGDPTNTPIIPIFFILLSFTGVWGSPQSAFGYPNAMLAKRVPPVSVAPD